MLLGAIGASSLMSQVLLYEFICNIRRTFRKWKAVQNVDIFMVSWHSLCVNVNLLELVTIVFSS
jgi:hypothetical protein